MNMPRSEYEPEIVYELKRRLWAEAFKFARELKKGKVPQHIEKSTISGLELLTVLHIMQEETRHHWIEDKKTWNDILGSASAAKEDDVF